VTLLKRKRILAAKQETTAGTIETLTAAEAAFNAYDVVFQQGISLEEREGQGGFGYLSSVVGGYTGTATFKVDLSWDDTGIPSWASVFLPACGYVDSSSLFEPVTAPPGQEGVKTLTIACFMDGVRKAIRGACGNVVFTFPTGRMATAEFTFTGIWVAPTDVALPAPTYPAAKPMRASSMTTTYDSITLCNESMSVDLGNEVVLRECATDASGFHAAIITNRNPKITCNPESKLVATRNTYGDFLAMEEAVFSASLAVGSLGNFIIYAPKAQVINVQEADRNRLVVDDIEFQCNRNGLLAADKDEELTFEFDLT
jgi:hypothetical protein